MWRRGQAARWCGPAGAKSPGRHPLRLRQRPQPAPGLPGIVVQGQHGAVAQVLPVHSGVLLPDHLGIGVEPADLHRAHAGAVAIGVLHQHGHGLAEHQRGERLLRPATQGWRLLRALISGSCTRTCRLFTVSRVSVWDGSCWPIFSGKFPPAAPVGLGSAAAPVWQSGRYSPLDPLPLDDG